MHLQPVLRPFWVGARRRYLPRVALRLVVRGSLLVGLWVIAATAVALHALARVLQLRVLHCFDACRHTFEQHLIEPQQPWSRERRERAFEQHATSGNVLASPHPWLNLPALNFGYRDARRYRPSAPWWPLPALHRRTFGAEASALTPLSDLLSTWHRTRRTDSFLEARGLSFLQVL